MEGERLFKYFVSSLSASLTVYLSVLLSFHLYICSHIYWSIIICLAFSVSSLYLSITPTIVYLPIFSNLCIYLSLPTYLSNIRMSHHTTSLHYLHHRCHHTLHHTLLTARSHTLSLYITSLLTALSFVTTASMRWVLESRKGRSDGFCPLLLWKKVNQVYWSQLENRSCYIYVINRLRLVILRWSYRVQKLLLLSLLINRMWSYDT